MAAFRRDRAAAVRSAAVRTAVLYDVHGNLPALEAVLAEVEAEAIEQILLGGDYALNGPDPAACVDRLRALADDAWTLQGNTDRWIVEGKDDDGVRWTAERLGPTRVAWLASLPTRIDLPRGATIAVHATPRSDEELLYPDTPEGEVRAMLEAVAGRLLLCGHTHVQYRRAVEAWTVVNPGSVGLPDDGDVRAAWAILDGSEVELRRTAYPIEETVRRMEASGSPVTRRSVVRFRTAHDPT